LLEVLPFIQKNEILRKNLFAPSTVLMLFTVISVTNNYAQGVAVSATGAAPHAVAMLHVDLGTSLEKGFLITGTSSALAVMPDLGPNKTVNPIDMIGIDMAAILALEKRTAQLADENRV
jgi:hypothetical protein